MGEVLDITRRIKEVGKEAGNRKDKLLGSILAITRLPSSCKFKDCSMYPCRSIRKECIKYQKATE